MVYSEAPVHDHFDAGCLQAPRDTGMANAYLHPYQNGLDLEHRIEQRRYVLGTPEDVHDVDWPGGRRGPQIRVDRLAEGDASYRMNRDDGVSCLLKVGCYSVTWPIGFPAQAHHSDTTGAAKNLRNP